MIILSNWWCDIWDTDFDGNIQEGAQKFLDILNAILGHKFHQNHPNSQIKWVKPTLATKSEFYYVCLLVCVCTTDFWSRSSFRVIPSMFPPRWCWQNNWSCTDNLPFTDCHQTHFHCKFWLHLPDINQSDWFQLYLWPSIAFKMSQEFPTACLDISHFETKFELVRVRTAVYCWLYYHVNYDS